MLKAAHKLHVELLAEAMAERPFLASQQDVAAFLSRCIGHRPAEVLLVLHVDGRHRVICHDVVAEGRVDAVPIDCRQIILRALERGSRGLILAHNHPSGDGRPSEADLRATRQVADCARMFDIALHDHLIVTGAEITSLRALNYL
jgi:DNA repair protein RadC